MSGVRFVPPLVIDQYVRQIQRQRYTMETMYYGFHPTRFHRDWVTPWWPYRLARWWRRAQPEASDRITNAWLALRGFRG